VEVEFSPPAAAVLAVLGVEPAVEPDAAEDELEIEGDCEDEFDAEDEVGDESELADDDDDIEDLEDTTARAARTEVSAISTAEVTG
jgi:hypothetical protein